MKSKIVIVALALMLILTACGQSGKTAEAPQSSEAPQSGGSVQIANPWRDVTEDEAKTLCPRSFGVPEGAENATWHVLDSVADASGVPGPLVQLSFERDGLDFTAREQVTGDEEIDNAGMYYDWTVQDESTLAGWGDGNMPCRLYRFVGEDEYADLCTWYDVEIGISYSLSVAAADLDGFDIRAVAEALYAPAD